MAFHVILLTNTSNIFSKRKTVLKTIFLPLEMRRKYCFYCLPFCGINSYKLKRQLERIIEKIAPWAKLNIIFRPYFRLKILSNLKSPVPLLNKSNVVYKINCIECNEFYIGMTKRRVHNG